MVYIHFVTRLASLTPLKENFIQKGFSGWLLSLSIMRKQYRFEEINFEEDRYIVI